MPAPSSKQGTDKFKHIDYPRFHPNWINPLSSEDNGSEPNMVKGRYSLSTHNNTSIIFANAFFVKRICMMEKTDGKN